MDRLPADTPVNDVAGETKRKTRERRGTGEFECARSSNGTTRKRKYRVLRLESEGWRHEWKARDSEGAVKRCGGFLNSFGPFHTRPARRVSRLQVSPHVLTRTRAQARACSHVRTRAHTHMLAPIVMQWNLMPVNLTGSACRAPQAVLPRPAGAALPLRPIQVIPNRHYRLSVCLSV
jgi:hypothetical protein